MENNRISEVTLKIPPSIAAVMIWEVTKL